MSKKELDKAIKEVKKRMARYNEPQRSNKGLMIGLGLAVIAALVGLVLWIRSKNDEDIEEYYEYFDDEMEEEFDEDLYGNEDLEDLQALDGVDEDNDVEYVEIKHFGISEDETEETKENE